MIIIQRATHLLPLVVPLVFLASVMAGQDEIDVQARRAPVDPGFEDSFDFELRDDYAADTMNGHSNQVYSAERLLTRGVVNSVVQKIKERKGHIYVRGPGLLYNHFGRLPLAGTTFADVRAHILTEMPNDKVRLLWQGNEPANYKQKLTKAGAEDGDSVYFLVDGPASLQRNRAAEGSSLREIGPRKPVQRKDSRKQAGSRAVKHSGKKAARKVGPNVVKKGGVGERKAGNQQDK